MGLTINHERTIANGDEQGLVRGEELLKHLSVLQFEWQGDVDGGMNVIEFDVRGLEFSGLIK